MDGVWVVLLVLVGGLILMGAIKRAPRDDQRRIPYKPTRGAPAMPPEHQPAGPTGQGNAAMDPNAIKLMEITLRKAERAEAEALALRIVCAALAAHIVHGQRDTGIAMSELALTLNVAVANVANGAQDQPALVEALGKVPGNVLEMAGELLGNMA